MDNQRRRQEYRVREKNHTVRDIITLTKDIDARSPTVAPIYDDESSVHYSLEHSPKEEDRDFISGDADYGSSNYPYPASKIPLPSQASPPNTSQEGAQADPMRKY